MDNVDYKAKLFEMIISGRGLQYVMDECAILLGNPFAFANQSLQLVCKSSSCSQYPGIFDWFEDQHGEKLEIAKEASKAGYFKSIYASDTPVYGRISGISANWVAARELLPLVCQTIAFALQQTGKYEYGTQNYEALLVELLDGWTNDTLDHESVRNHFKLLGHDLPKKMRLLIVRANDPEHTVNRIVLDTQLRSQFPLSLGTLYKNDCVRILDDKLSLDMIEERLHKYLHSDHIICGISRSFTSVFSLKDAYLQADAALRLRKPSKNKFLFQFDDVSGPYVLEQVEAARVISPNGVLMPEILELLEAKESVGFERIQDLAAYMSCGRNVTRAAELRGVHKNSMYYRLDKIMDMTRLDLNDDDVCVQVMLSLTLMGFLPFSPSIVL